jgi:hypothetical protein
VAAAGVGADAVTPDAATVAAAASHMPCRRFCMVIVSSILNDVDVSNVP